MVGRPIVVGRTIVVGRPKLWIYTALLTILSSLSGSVVVCAWA